MSISTMRRNKYNNKFTEVDGRVFASLKEAARYKELRLREYAGEIRDLELQPSFEIIVKGHRICRYLADFKYIETATGQLVVEDTKSTPTKKNPVYRLKKKLVEAIYSIRISEV